MSEKETRALLAGLLIGMTVGGAAALMVGVTVWPAAEPEAQSPAAPQVQPRADRTEATGDAAGGEGDRARADVYRRSAMRLSPRPDGSGFWPAGIGEQVRERLAAGRPVGVMHEWVGAAVARWANWMPVAHRDAWAQACVDLAADYQAGRDAPEDPVWREINSPMGLYAAAANVADDADLRCLAERLYAEAQRRDMAEESRHAIARPQWRPLPRIR